MDYKKFEKYIKERRGSISIPEVQYDFNCRYNEAKKAFDMAVDDNLLSYIGGIYYEINETKELPERLRGLYYGTARNKPKPRKSEEEEKQDEQSRVKKYIRRQGEITVPELQKQFNLNYAAAYKLMRDFVDEKFIEYSEGLTYKVISVREKKDPSEMTSEERREYIESTRREIFRRLKDYKSYEENDDDDDDDGETDEQTDDDDDIVKPRETPKLSADDLAKLRRRYMTERLRKTSKDYAAKFIYDNENKNDKKEANGENDYDSAKRRMLDDEIKRRKGEQEGAASPDQTLKDQIAKLAAVLASIAAKKSNPSG